MGTKEDVENFIEKYVHAKRLHISSLIELYRKSTPSAHPDCNSSCHSEAGMAYCMMRLPREISETTKVTVSADMKYLRKIKEKSEYSQIFCRKRKRLYFYSKQEEHLIIGINSISDIHDIIPVLTGFLLEIRKLEKLAVNHENIADSFSVEHANSLAKYLGLNQLGLEEYFRKLILKKDFLVELKKCDDVHCRNRAALWGDWLMNVIEENFDVNRNLYVIFSNSHSIVNPLSSFTRMNSDKIWDWALTQSRFKDLLSEVSDGSVWKDDALYFLQREYFQQNGKEKDLLRDANEQSGIFRFTDSEFNGPTFHAIDMSKLDAEHNDSRVFDNAIQNIEDKQALILNVDFTMGGYQARYILEEILRRFPDLKGLYIFGKAGAMEGKVGDIVLPSFLFDNYDQNYIFYNNDLKSKYIRRYLRKGDILESHGMLTVSGVLLQNMDYLHYYFQQNLTGIEMEGGPYLEAIISKLSSKCYEGKIIHFPKLPFDFGIAYYVSDTPYHEGKTLGTLGRVGLEAVYALSIAVINRILIKESSIRIGMESFISS